MQELDINKTNSNNTENFLSGITSHQNSATFQNKQQTETTEDEKESFNYCIDSNQGAKLQDSDDHQQEQL